MLNDTYKYIENSFNKIGPYNKIYKDENLYIQNADINEIPRWTFPIKYVETKVSGSVSDNLNLVISNINIQKNIKVQECKPPEFILALKHKNAINKYEIFNNFLNNINNELYNACKTDGVIYITYRTDVYGQPWMYTKDAVYGVFSVCVLSVLEPPLTYNPIIDSTYQFDYAAHFEVI